jgi:hypothetical protein
MTSKESSKLPLSFFLEKHGRDNVLIVLDTSGWLRLFRAVPNRVPGFLFNYFNCGYPLRITGHIQEEFRNNLDYVQRNVVEVQNITAKNLDRGKNLQYFAMDKARSERKGNIYKKLLALYGGKGTNASVRKMIQSLEKKPVVSLTEEETRQGEVEAAKLSKEGRPFPGCGDFHKTGNIYGDYLIFLELQKLAREESADIIFATNDYKEKPFWPCFEEEFKKKTNFELLYIDIPSFDQFADRFGAVAEEVAGRDQRNEIINSKKHLREVEVQYAPEAGKAVEDYFALDRCYLSASNWRKQPVAIKLLNHKETGFKVDFGASDYGCVASYDCSFEVKAQIEITYQIIPEDRNSPLTKQKEVMNIEGAAFAVITRHYDFPEDILKLKKKHWIDVSNIDFDE